jgi:hypothetical protein
VNASGKVRSAVLFQYRAADDAPAKLVHINWGVGLVVAGLRTFIGTSFSDPGDNWTPALARADGSRESGRLSRERTARHVTG